MGLLNGDTSSGVVAPWSADTGRFLAELQATLPHDAALLGVVDLRAPVPEAFLAARGVSREALVNWCDTSHGDDPLLREARRKGVARGRTTKGEPGPPLPASLHVMVHALPTDPGGRRVWLLMLARKSGAFSDDEARRGELVMRLLHAEFDHIGEPGLGRVLLDHEYQLIHTDPRSEAQFLADPTVLREFAERLPPILAQRWPSLTDAAGHDVAMELAGRPVWVRVRRDRPVPELDRAHWYLELRPLSEQDIPAVGVIEDERVARAVAYLSDEYAKAPTLTDVAEAVQTSPFHFHRLFVKHVSLSPKHYLLRMQLMIAKWLLRTTRQSIGDIAKATGFASHGHFTATFHRIVGVSPSTYREQG